MINHIEIKGYKSIKEAKIDLSPINILIGGNGVGKSNFISFFKLMNAIFNKNLQKYIAEQGADNILYFGRKHTEELRGKMIFSDDDLNNNSYIFGLAQNKTGGLYLGYEGSGYNVSKDDDTTNYFYHHAIEESIFSAATYKRHRILQNYMSSLRVFHFHDTSSTSFLRRDCDLNDNLYLKPDGRNLPAFLYLLKIKNPIIYNRILKIIQTVAPYLSALILEPDKLNDRNIALRWVDAGDPASSFDAYQLSDGTIRFIALTTLLMQPNPPEVIIIDEPELGLHPFAIGKLAGMIQTASSKTQLIIGTQSPGLISHFSAEDIVVMDKSVEQNQTVFHRLNEKSLSVWLEDYTLGELWERNIIDGGQPFSK